MGNRAGIIFGGVFLFLSLAYLHDSGLTASGKDESGRPVFDPSKHPGLVDASRIAPGLQVELKYATKDNFTKINLYGDFKTCYLVREAAEMLRKAQENLSAYNPDLSLKAYDCLRPRRVQRVMWNKVKGTPMQSYVANPYTKTASIHNYGCAVDVTLSRKDGRPLDMGTDFDFFGKASQPRHEIKSFKAGKLTGEQYANRLLLREVMVRAGFIPISNEWWHFNCAAPREVRRRYKIIE